MKKTDTKTLIQTMRILARHLYSEDGVANAAISEAADRLEELQAQHRKDDDEYIELWQIYGDLEDERDRLRELLSTAIAWTQNRGYDDPHTAPEWYIAALKEANDDRQ